MNTLYIATGLLAIALIVSLVHYLRTKDSDLLPPEEQMVKINGLEADFVVFDEAEKLKPKQMKSRPRRKK